MSGRRDKTTQAPFLPMPAAAERPRTASASRWIPNRVCRSAARHRSTDVLPQVPAWLHPFYFWLRSCMREGSTPYRHAPRLRRDRLRRVISASGWLTALIQHYRADRLTLLHQVKAFINALERQCVRDQVIDVDLAFHVPV